MVGFTCSRGKQPERMQSENYPNLGPLIFDYVLRTREGASSIRLVFTRNKALQLAAAEVLSSLSRPPRPGAWLAVATGTIV